MKRMLVLPCILLTASVAFGPLPVEDLSLLEHFDELSFGTIDMQGVALNDGVPIEMWNAQEFSSYRGDHGLSFVWDDDDRVCLHLLNRNISSQLGLTFTTMYLGSGNIIEQQGTVYMRFKTDGPTDCILATNDLLPGYPSDIRGAAGMDDPDYQGLVNYVSMGMMCYLTTGEPFRVRDGEGGYRDADLILEPDRWYELLIQLDCLNARSRLFIRDDERTIMPVINPATGEDWWAWRNEAHLNAAVVNLKWFHGAGDAEQRLVCIDDVSVNATQMVDFAVWRPWPVPGDANLDNLVDIKDFVILKKNYGQMKADWQQGDFNYDGHVDIKDFFILKQHYGEAWGD